MAITVLPYLSPRLLIVAAPDTEITVQEIIDQVRDWEDGEEGMAYPYIISAAGKENLGGGVTVGITCTLQNARIAFEARTTPTETGTVTTADGTGLVLTDNTATFVSNGVTVGAHVVNKATGASGSVVSVDSETQLTLLQALGGGTRNDFQIGDDYAVHNIIPCSISGGNLVAVDDVGADLDPVFPTAWTQVVRTSSSSATLQELQDIQYASFAGGVWYDMANGTAGTVFPVGTERQPCNNLTDVKTIAEARGFDTIYVVGDMSLGSSLDFNGYTFIGRGQTLSTFTIDTSANVLNCVFKSATVTGTLDGQCNIVDATLDDVTVISGVVENSMIDPGTITLGGSQTAHFLDCKSGVPGVSTPIIDMGGSGQDLAMRNYNGGIRLENLSGAQSVSIDLNSGQCVIDTTTVTNGTIVVRGIGKVIDEAGDWMVSGTYGSMTLINEVQGSPSLQIVENTITTDQALRLILAAVAGKASGANTTTMRFRDTGDSKDRIVATVDEFGNRSSVTLSPD